jgi:hypothetical protein
VCEEGSARRSHSSGRILLYLLLVRRSHRCRAACTSAVVEVVRPAKGVEEGVVELADLVLVHTENLALFSLAKLALWKTADTMM